MQQSKTLKIPAKTFLLGEYNVLEDGSCLVLAHEPYFETSFHANPMMTSPFHQQSPAGRFISLNAEKFSDLEIHFKDHSQGGWGASTAQFLSVYEYAEAITIERETHTISKMRQDYVRCAWSGRGYPPSGADLIAQLYGGLTYQQAGVVKELFSQWPFENLSGVLVKTPVKIATHEHLEKLPPFNSSGFEKLVQQGVQAFKTNQENLLIEAVNGYQQELIKQKLTLESTLHLIEDFRAWAGFRAAKGCGALGADFIFLIVEKAHWQSISASLDSKKLTYHLIENKFAEGLQWKS